MLAGRVARRRRAPGPATRSARLHAATAGDAEVAAAFGDYEAFAQLRLEPYYGTVMERLPQLAAALAPLVDELRDGAHLPRARRLRAQEHAARARRRVAARRGGRARRAPGLRSRVLPRVPAAHGRAEAGARGGLQPCSSSASRRPTRVARGALATPPPRRRRPHRRDGARTHRRPLARVVPLGDCAPDAPARSASGCCWTRRPTWPQSWRRADERPLDRAGARVRGARLARDADGRLRRSRSRGGAEACATIPSGASTGRHEAHERRDGGERYAGRGVRAAVAAVNGEIAAALRGRDAADQAVIDAALRDLDGTPALARLGAQRRPGRVGRVRAGRRRGRAHAALAPARPGSGPAPAAADGQRALGRRARRPGARRPGRARRSRRRRRTFAEAIEHAARVRAGAAAELRERGHATSLVADEGGLAAALETNEEALEIATRGIERAGIEAALALDVAATQLVDGDGYRLAREESPAGRRGARARGRRLGRALPARLDRGSARRGRLGRLAARRPSCSASGVQLLGDDLFATSTERLAHGIVAGRRQRGAGQAESGRHALGRARGARAGPARGLRDGRLGALGRHARTPGSPISRSAGARARSRSARRSAPSARRSGTACCASRPSAGGQRSRRGSASQ